MDVNDPHSIIEEFENTLDKLQHTKENHQLALVEKMVSLCSLALLDLREIVITNGFKSREEEIYFFKYLKPKVYSKFIYYAKLFKIICRRPLRYYPKKCVKFKIY
jgi:hypothetical protein